MIQFIFVKQLDRTYSIPSNLRSGDQDWRLLFPLLSEIWGQPWKINYLRAFLNQASLEDNYDCKGFNNGSYVEDNADGFIIIASQWSEGYEFRFPKEKFKQFLEVLDEMSKMLYPMSIYDSPDLLQFTIDDDWDTCIERIYLNTDKSFFKKDGTGRPQFRLERVKNYDYKVIQSDCADDLVSRTLGTFVEDLWYKKDEELSSALKLLNSPDDGIMYYNRCFFEKKGDVVQLNQATKQNDKGDSFTLSSDELYAVITLTQSFISSLKDVPLDKLPGMIFYTVDEYWNVIPVPLFRPEDNNFVNKE